MRIVSLLPSATEIVCCLGLEPQLVGITHECDHPPQIRDRPSVTVTLIPRDATSGEIDALVRQQRATDRALYHLNMDVLTSLRPDLIVTQALCDVCAVAADEVEAAACHLPGTPQVVNLEPMTLDQVFEAITLVGQAAGREEAAHRVVNGLWARTNAVVRRTAGIDAERPRVAFLEWIDPLFNAGHWTPELIAMAGGVDILGEVSQPSRTISEGDLVASNADVVVISCCGYTAERAREDLPVLERIPGWHELPAVRGGRVHVFDGNAYFSRPGPRLVDSLELLAHALHPTVHPAPDGTVEVLSESYPT